MTSLARAGPKLYLFLTISTASAITPISSALCSIVGAFHSGQDVISPENKLSLSLVLNVSLFGNLCSLEKKYPDQASSWSYPIITYFLKMPDAMIFLILLLPGHAGITATAPCLRSVRSSYDRTGIIFPRELTISVRHLADSLFLKRITMFVSPEDEIASISLPSLIPLDCPVSGS